MIIELWQRAYRKYRQTKYNIPPENSNKMVAQAIIKNINKKIVNNVINRADIPVDNRKDLMKVGDQLRRMINNKLTCICIEDEGIASFIIFRKYIVKI